MPKNFTLAILMRRDRKCALNTKKRELVSQYWKW